MKITVIKKIDQCRKECELILVLSDKYLYNELKYRRLHNDPVME